jgi:hypothetical protein
MSYRPICDMWWLARPKLKDSSTFYGAYLGGFPERARALLGVTISDPVLHVCGGKARQYPYEGGFGPNDRTLDLDPATEPDFLRDAREPLPRPECRECSGKGEVWRAAAGMPYWCEQCNGSGGDPLWRHWPAILIDPPYSEDDAAKYAPGRDVYPSPNLLLRNALQAVRPGGRVGIIHYLIPQPPSAGKAGFRTRFVASVGVAAGFNNRIRVYSVYERLEEHQ